MIYSDQFPLSLLLLGSSHLLTYSITSLLSRSLFLFRKQRGKKEKKNRKEKEEKHTHIRTNHIYPHTSKICINTKLETIIHKQKTSKV